MLGEKSKNILPYMVVFHRDESHGIRISVKTSQAYSIISQFFDSSLQHVIILTCQPQTNSVRNSPSFMGHGVTGQENYQSTHASITNLEVPNAHLAGNTWLVSSNEKFQGMKCFQILDAKGEFSYQKSHL